MTNVINFPNRNKPDNEHVFVDEEGTTWFEYTCSYTDARGVEMGFELWAVSPDDAKSRIAALKANAKVDGQIYKTVDA